MQIKTVSYLSRLLIAVAVLSLALPGCSSKEPTKKFVVEYYQPAYRQLPPEPVYNRVTYSHLPQPLVAESTDKSPYLKPNFAFDFKKTPFSEAVGALAQTIGYRLQLPRELKDKKVSVEMVGTPEEILGELATQAGVVTELDHAERVIRVYKRASVAARQ